MKEKKELSKEEIAQYVENYNNGIAGAPLSFIIYRELLGILWYLTQNKRLRDVFVTLLTFIEEKEITSYNELLNVLENSTTQSIFDEGMIEDLFKLRVIDENE